MNGSNDDDDELWLEVECSFILVYLMLTAMMLKVSNATNTTTTTVAIPKDVQQDRYNFDCIERKTARLA